MANPAKAKKTKAADWEANPTVIKSDGSKIAPPEALPETEEQRINRLVSERVAVEIAGMAQDAATDTLPEHQEDIRQIFTADLQNAIHTLAELFDIDIEQVNPEDEPVQYAQRAWLRDICWNANRNVDFNTGQLAKKSAQLTGMCNRHKGDEMSDVKIQNVTVFMKGIEDQLELWNCYNEAAQAAYLHFVGNEYGKDPASGNRTAAVTAAVSEARKIASRHLSSNPKSEANRADNDRKAMEAENEVLRRALADAS